MRARIIFFGTPNFALPSLELLIRSGFTPIAVVTRAPKPVGRHAVLTSSAIATTAKKLRLPLLEPASIKKPDFIEWFRAQKPDLAILVAYGKIIPEDVLAVPRLGFINVHPSLLPRHRGASPIANTILSGDTITGVTIMQLDAEMDHGSILSQQKISVPLRATTGSFTPLLAKLGAKLLVEVLPKYLAGALQAKTQNHGQATYSKILKRSDGDIDWGRPALELDRFVRAYSPWPGAFTCLRGTRLKLLEVHPADQKATQPPGTIITRAGKLLVATGQNYVELERVQLAGGRAQSGADFVNGHPELSGARVMLCQSPILPSHAG
ncbi:MAG: methionyl-tRNA formyltransferase [Parcubacteria group bacterium]